MLFKFLGSLNSYICQRITTYKPKVFFFLCMFSFLCSDLRTVHMTKMGELKLDHFFDLNYFRFLCFFRSRLIGHQLIQTKVGFDHSNSITLMIFVFAFQTQERALRRSKFRGGQKLSTIVKRSNVLERYYERSKRVFKYVARYYTRFVSIVTSSFGNNVETGLADNHM